ncbi:MAG: HNH endonuclease [Pseudobdellovibrionaceae bacterium]
MSKYGKLSNSEMVQTLKSKSQTERNLTVEVIELLEEMESRKYYLELGFDSLMDFCIKELKYSESAAYRRVSAMRASREVPEIKQSIQEGTLNLVNVTQAQTLFRAEAKNNNAYSKEEKRILLKSLENKSKREAEKIIANESPLLMVQEKVRAIGENKTQMTLVLEEALMEKLDKIKSLTSHKNPNPTYSELIDMLADFALKKLDPQTPPEKECKAQAPVVVSKNSRYVSRSVKRAVWKEGKCSHRDSATGRKCGSRFQLQIDHITPVAKGGKSNVENLRLVCRNHNIMYARKEFGENFMNQFSKESNRTH